MTNERLYYLMLLICFAAWSPQFISALIRQGLTAGDMRRRGHTDEGEFLPFIWHGPAMWGNLLIIPYVMGEISQVYRFWEAPLWRLFFFGIAALAVSMFLHHKIWKHGKTPEEHNERPGKLSPTGHIQVMYLAVVLTILFESSTAVGGLNPWHAFRIIAPLYAYLVLSTHILPWVLKRPFWRKNPFKDPMGLSMILGSAVPLGAVWARIVFWRSL